MILQNPINSFKNEWVELKKKKKKLYETLSVMIIIIIVQDTYKRNCGIWEKSILWIKY